MSRLRLTFHGAARAVTGSCFRLETEHGQILIDCGLFQGSKTEKELNYRPFPFAPNTIAAVILSHAHIDHSGLLPKLVRNGFSGPIHATPATADLAGVMLPDSAHIQEIEVEQFNRRAARRNRGKVTPIYTSHDADACLALFRPQPYDSWFRVLPGLRARFWNAGHLLGSASVEVEVAQADSTPVRILFSADIGPDYKLMHPDPEGPRICHRSNLRGTMTSSGRHGSRFLSLATVTWNEGKAHVRPLHDDDTVRDFVSADFSFSADGGSSFFLRAQAGYDSGDDGTLDVRGGLQIPR